MKLIDPLLRSESKKMVAIKKSIDRLRIRPRLLLRVTRKPVQQSTPVRVWRCSPTSTEQIRL